MIVKDAVKEIEKLNDAMNNLGKLKYLSKGEYERIADKLEIDEPLVSLVDIAVKAIAYQISILQNKIDNADID